MLEITEVARGNALRGLTLKIQDKGIYGVLTADDGTRDALADLLCGCENAESGEIRINGELMCRRATEPKRRVRVVPKSLNADRSTTPAEHMDFIGQALGVDVDKRYRQIKEATELMAIEDVQNKLCSLLTPIQALRVSIAAALIGNPDVIVLNDPFSDIEERSLGEVFETLRMLGEIKTLVLLSKKASCVKALCRDMAIVCGGTVVLEGNICEIEKKINSTHELHVCVRGEYERVSRAIESVDGVVSVKLIKAEKNDVNRIRVEHKPDRGIKDKLFAALSQIGASMLSLSAVELTLEDVFYSLTRSDREAEEATEREESTAKKKGKRGLRKK